MRNYISKFFEDFEYNVDDATVLLADYDRIDSCSDARDAFASAIAIYEADLRGDYRAMISLADRAAACTGVHEYTAEFLLFVCLSKKLKEYYLERGLDLAVYHNSMLDLRYKVDECKLVYGIVGSFVADWFIGFFDLTRFAFGRLQFEVIDFKENYEKDGHRLAPESRVINVHIPRSGEPLTDEACANAYRIAKNFFGAEVGDPTPFVCNSWLLNPAHEEFLPKHTNTYRFFKSFDVFRTDLDRDRKNLWRLFDTMEKNCDKLPADSSIRRAYIEFLKNGGKMASGYGVFFL